MTRPRETHWDHVFETGEDTALTWHQEAPQPSLELIEAHGAGSGAGVIDVGAGTARLVDALLDRGYGDITLLDVSEAALAATRARLGPRAARVAFIAADITEWRPARRWDVWHDRAVMHFLVDEADQAAYRAALMAGTAAGSIVVLGTFSPAGPDRCSGLPVRQWTGAALLAFLGPERFDLLEARPHSHLTPRGTLQAFEYSVLRRKQAA